MRKSCARGVRQGPPRLSRVKARSNYLIHVGRRTLRIAHLGANVRASNDGEVLGP